ncbi:MAG: cyclic pyranopterin monophosphate synthase MoaC [Desulfomonilia bacterium]|nr:cyclic pyranopterin monophosphate synthase MoaC [Desulfomonilia bacterium]
MGLSHLDDQGRVVMVDVGRKKTTQRLARARGIITMSEEAFDAIMGHGVKKGNVLVTSQIAGIMAAKQTSLMIPLCHPLPISQVSVNFSPRKADRSIEAEAVVTVSGPTGVEMEALHAVSVALLTIYDMVKAIDKAMVISDICLVEKSGGKSGTYRRTEDD